ncbi:MAG: hypothetical protein ACYS15_19115 [Planctomycetota bacterium]|jgi:hypothetical protein
MIRARTIWTILGITATVIAAAVLVAWLAGRVISDRYGWSQWLLWIPTPAVLPAVLLGIAGACRPDPASGRGRRRRRLIVWAGVGAAVALYFLVIEHRFLRWGAGDPGALTLLQSSVYPGQRQAGMDYADRLIAAGADVTILSNPLASDNRQRVERELGKQVMPHTLPFMVFTRLPILAVRPLVVNNARRVYIVVLRLDTTAELGRPITVYAVDLPSGPKRPRHEIARAVRRMLESVAAPPPDIVVGDFNMTRGSTSMNALFPGFAHAWDQAGRGYGATFPRGFPLYHLDHTLLADTVQATDYTLVDLGIGRHLAQRVELAPGPGG